MKHLQPILLLISGALIGFLCATTLSIAHSEALDNAPKFNYDQVVAQIGETRITRAQLAENLINAKGSRGGSLGMETLTGELQNFAVVREAARQAGVIVSEEEVTQRIDEAVKVAKNAASLEQTRENQTMLAQLESTPRPLLLETYRVMLLAEKMMKLTITEDDINNYYIQNVFLFTVPKMVDAIVISTRDKATATEIWKQMNSGQNSVKEVMQFSAKNSSDPHLRSVSGELGWRTRAGLPLETQLAVFGEDPMNVELKPGHFTPVITVRAVDPIRQAPINEYAIVYVRNTTSVQKLALKDIHDVVAFYARSKKYLEMAPQWFTSDATMAIAKGWKQVKDLNDPTSALEDKPIGIETWSFPILPSSLPIMKKLIPNNTTTK